MNMLVALTRTGQVQVVVNIPVTPFRRAVPGGNRGGCESNCGSVMSYRHKFINFVVGKPGGENRVSENKTLTSWKLEQIRNLLSH